MKREVKVVDIKYLLKHTPWCKATIYNRVKAGTFPKHRKSGRNTYWLLSEVEEYLSTGDKPSAHQDNQPNPAWAGGVLPYIQRDCIWP